MDISGQSRELLRGHFLVQTTRVCSGGLWRFVIDIYNLYTEDWRTQWAASRERSKSFSLQGLNTARPQSKHEIGPSYRAHMPPQLHKHSLRRNGSLFLFSISPTRRVLVLVMVMVLRPTEWTSCVILKLIKAWMLDALVVVVVVVG